jgi:hypothetical protein
MKKARGDFWLLGVKNPGGKSLSVEERIWNLRHAPIFRGFGEQPAT